MPYSKAVPLDPHQAAHDLHHWSPLARLEHAVGIEGILGTLLLEPHRDTQVLETVRETFIDGIASVLHLESDQSEESQAYLEHLARKAMEAEDQVLARKQTMEIGIFAAAGVSRMVFVPTGTTVGQFDDYKTKLQDLAESHVLMMATPALRGLKLESDTGLAARVNRAALQAEPRDLLIAFGKATACGAKGAKWAEEFLVTLQRNSRPPIA